MGKKHLWSIVKVLCQNVYGEARKIPISLLISQSAFKWNPNKLLLVPPEALTVMTVMISAYWEVVPCSLAKID